MKCYMKLIMSVECCMFFFFNEESMRNFCFRTGYLELVHQVLVLWSSCIPVNVGVNEKGVNEKGYSHIKKKSLNKWKSGAEGC